MTLLNRTECAVLRGIAIIGIFMHNFLHWMPTMLHENEYNLWPNNVEAFAHTITHPHLDLPLQLMSFFGHYGVPVFVFLSGYGLYLKYEADRPAPIPFLYQHFCKLFPMMLLGFVVFFFVDNITPDTYDWNWGDIIKQLTMTINIFPEPRHHIWPGPYWFFGLIMQLYLIYIIFMRGRDWKWTVALMVICTILQATCYEHPDREPINYMRYNFIGNMVPFGLGWLTAQFKAEEWTEGRGRIMIASIAVISLLFIFVGSLNFWSWLFVPIAVVIFHVALVKVIAMIPYVGNGLIRLLAWMGALSSAIFVCHPTTRKLFIEMAKNGNDAEAIILYVVTTIILALIFRQILSYLHHRQR